MSPATALPELPQLDQVIAALVDAGGPALSSVLLYGSAAGGGYKPGKSNVNVLAVLSSEDAEAMRRLSPVVARLRAELVVVHVTTTGELSAAARVFPLQVLELSDHHRVLWGDVDPVAGVEVAEGHLRADAERALRTVARHVREGLMLHGDERRELGRVVRKRFRQLVYALRGALRCVGELPATTDKHPTLERAATRFGLDHALLLALLSFRRRLSPVPPAEIERLAEGLLTAAITAAEQVRALGSP